MGLDLACVVTGSGLHQFWNQSGLTVTLVAWCCHHARSLYPRCLFHYWSVLLIHVLEKRSGLFLDFCGQHVGHVAFVYLSVLPTAPGI